MGNFELTELVLIIELKKKVVISVLENGPKQSEAQGENILSLPEANSGI